MASNFTEAEFRGAAPEVDITQTRSRAGALLEQGAAFIQLEAQGLQPLAVATPPATRRPRLRSASTLSLSAVGRPGCRSATTWPARG